MSFATSTAVRTIRSFSLPQTNARKLWQFQEEILNFSSSDKKTAHLSYEEAVHDAISHQPANWKDSFKPPTKVLRSLQSLVVLMLGCDLRNLPIYVSVDRALSYWYDIDFFFMYQDKYMIPVQLRLERMKSRAYPVDIVMCPFDVRSIDKFSFMAQLIALKCLNPDWKWVSDGKKK